MPWRVASTLHFDFPANLPDPAAELLGARLHRTPSRVHAVQQHHQGPAQVPALEALAVRSSARAARVEAGDARGAGAERARSAAAREGARARAHRQRRRQLGPRGLAAARTGDLSGPDWLGSGRSRRGLVPATAAAGPAPVPTEFERSLALSASGTPRGRTGLGAATFGQGSRRRGSGGDPEKLDRQDAGTDQPGQSFPIAITCPRALVLIPSCCSSTKRSKLSRAT